MKSYLSIIISSFVGVLIGGTAWFIIYTLNRTESIEFDGPAGVILGISMIATGSVSSLISIIIWIKEQTRTARQVATAAVICFVAIMVSSAVVGLLIGNYAKNNDGHPPLALVDTASI